MASPVLSVQKHTLTISGGSATDDTAALTGSPTTANCIPFVSTRVVTTGSNPDEFSAYAVRADFTGGDTVRVTTANRDLASREIVCEVTVVEFNPAEVNVYQGQGEFDGSETLVLNDPYGASVDVVLAKSFLYFTYTTDNSSEQWVQHNIRGVMTDADTLTFDAINNQGEAGVDASLVNWYVAEAINTAWAVDHVAIQLSGAQTTNTDTFTAVDDGKTCVFGSYKGSSGSTDTDGCQENTIDVTLTDSGGDTWDTVTATRLLAVGIIDWAGCVVELAGNENVYRGQLTTTNASPDTGTSRTITTAVTEADSMVHTCGMTGILGGSGNDDANSDDVPAVFYAWTFASSTLVDCEHYTGQSNFQAADVTWEVIEWDVGGAPPATRRVMVIS